MSGEALAGRLRARVTIWRETEGRDPLGAGSDWTLLRAGRADIRPEARGPFFVGDGRAALPVWRVTMRTGDLGVGDRIDWGPRTMIVREIRTDPAQPDRIVGIAEEER